MLNMPRSKVVRINASLYLNVPAEEARRLNLREGQTVEFEVHPTGAPVKEIVADLRGKYKGRFREVEDEALWGEGWA